MAPPWHTSPVLRPLPCPGLYFHRRQFGAFDSALPHDKTRTFAASWFSVDDDRDDFPSCHVVADLDRARNIHIVECALSAVSLRDAMARVFAIHDALERVEWLAAIERRPGQSYGVRQWFCPQEQHAAAEIMASRRRQEMRKRNEEGGAHLSALHRPFDMDASARILQSEIASGRVLLPRAAPWVQAFLGELCQWPMVRQDARVRAMCVLARALQDVAAPVRAPRHAASEQARHWMAG